MNNVINYSYAYFKFNALVEHVLRNHFRLLLYAKHNKVVSSHVKAEFLFTHAQFAYLIMN